MNFFTFYSLRFPQIQRIGVSPQRTLTDANRGQQMQLSMRPWYEQNGGTRNEKTTKHFCVCACELLQEHNFQSDFCDMQSAPTLQPTQLLQWHSRIQWSLWMCKKEKNKTKCKTITKKRKKVMIHSYLHHEIIICAPFYQKMVKYIPIWYLIR